MAVDAEMTEERSRRQQRNTRVLGNITSKLTPGEEKRKPHNPDHIRLPESSIDLLQYESAATSQYQQLATRNAARVRPSGVLVTTNEFHRRLDRFSSSRLVGTLDDLAGLRRGSSGKAHTSSSHLAHGDEKSPFYEEYKRYSPRIYKDHTTSSTWCRLITFAIIFTRSPPVFTNIDLYLPTTDTIVLLPPAPSHCSNHHDHHLPRKGLQHYPLTFPFGILDGVLTRLMSQKGLILVSSCCFAD